MQALNIPRRRGRKPKNIESVEVQPEVQSEFRKDEDPNMNQTKHVDLNAEIRNLNLEENLANGQEERPNEEHHSPEEKQPEINSQEKDAEYEKTQKEKRDRAAANIERKLKFALNGPKHLKAYQARMKAMSKEERDIYKSTKRKARDYQKRAGLFFPIKRARTMLKECCDKKVTKEAAVYTASILEYMCAEVLEIAGGIVQEQKRKRITPRDIMLAIKTDVEIEKAVGTNLIIKNAGVPVRVIPDCLKTSNFTRDKNQFPNAISTEIIDISIKAKPQKRKSLANKKNKVGAENAVRKNVDLGQSTSTQVV